MRVETDCANCRTRDFEEEEEEEVGEKKKKTEEQEEEGNLAEMPLLLSQHEQSMVNIIPSSSFPSPSCLYTASPVFNSANLFLVSSCIFHISAPQCCVRAVGGL